MVRLWDTDTFTEVAVLTGHRDYVWSLAWSEDGRRLISGSGDRTVRIWEAIPERVRLKARRERAAMVAELEPLIAGWFSEFGDAEDVHERLVEEFDGRRREVAGQVLLRLATTKGE